MVGEVCGPRYQADGFEMDMYVGQYFKPAEVERHTPLFTKARPAGIVCFAA